MSYIAGKDTIRGTDGMVVIVYPDRSSEELIQIVNIEATATINQDEVPRIGTRTIGHKVSTVTFEGTATAYYGSPALRNVFINYLTTGEYPQLDILIQNYDHDTQAKSQIARLKNVVFTSQCIAKLDAESTSLQEDLEFTFENFIISDPSNADRHGLDIEPKGFDKTEGVNDNNAWHGEPMEGLIDNNGGAPYNG